MAIAVEQLTIGRAGPETRPSLAVVGVQVHPACRDRKAECLAARRFLGCSDGRRSASVLRVWQAPGGREHDISLGFLETFP